MISDFLGRHRIAHFSGLVPFFFAICFVPFPVTFAFPLRLGRSLPTKPSARGIFKYVPGVETWRRRFWTKHENSFHFFATWLHLRKFALGFEYA